MRLRLRPRISLVVVSGSLALVALSLCLYAIQNGAYPFLRLRGRR